MIPTKQYRPYGFDVEGIPTKKAFGRCNNYESIKKIYSATNTIHDTAKIMSPAKSRDNLLRLKQLSDSYSPQGAVSVDACSFFKAIRENIFEAPDDSPNVMKCELEKIRNFTIELHSFQAFSRPSEVTKYVPTIEDLRFPTLATDYIDGVIYGGMPKWIIVALNQWKGHGLGKPPMFFKFHANFVDAKYNLVLHILILLAKSNLTRVSIGILLPYYYLKFHLHLICLVVNYFD